MLLFDGENVWKEKKYDIFNEKKGRRRNTYVMNKVKSDFQSNLWCLFTILVFRLEDQINTSCVTACITTTSLKCAADAATSVVTPRPFDIFSLH